MSTDTEAGFTTEIPMTFRRRGGKAVIVLPDGSRAIERREALIDNAMVKLLARGHRWHRKLFDGTHASIEDMAKSENISPSFVSRILRLAYLSPTIVEAILDGKYPAHLTMKASGWSIYVVGVRRLWRRLRWCRLGQIIGQKSARLAFPKRRIVAAVCQQFGMGR